jgi:tannase/feruloyl esterase
VRLYTRFTHFFAAATLTVQAIEADPASYIPKAKLPAIESAVLSACDALDGLRDGILTDPRKCRFNPEVLGCQGKESDACLTDAQLVALKRIYAGAVTATGESVYPGYLAGAETGSGGWAIRIIGEGPGTSSKFLFVQTVGRHIIFQNPAWDYRNFELGRDLKLADEAVGHVLNATEADLRAFKERGGKLILYHGWSDAALPPMGTVEYYESIILKMGEKDAQNFVRLYMVPGMQHCGGGPGPNIFARPVTEALQHWVEEGIEPGTIIATRYKGDGEPTSGMARTRPLCPYPQQAQYKGTGSIDEASNFACRLP